LSFNTNVRQKTEMFQWWKCLSKSDRNISAKKKQYSSCSGVCIIIRVAN